MRSPICDMLGVEFPLLAFSHCRDVVVAVSRAGGMGVFGAVKHPPEQLEEELRSRQDALSSSDRRQIRQELERLIEKYLKD